MNYNKILERLKYWKMIDDKNQKAMDLFCQTLAASSYSPILEDTCVHSFISGIEIVNKDIAEWLEYYIYENPKPKNEKWNVKDEHGNKYDFTKRPEVIKFFESNF